VAKAGALATPNSRNEGPFRHLHSRRQRCDAGSPGHRTRAGGVLKGELGGLRRIRVGTYRIIYEVYDERLTILVVRVAHRREAYR